MAYLDAVALMVRVLDKQFGDKGRWSVKLEPVVPREDLPQLSVCEKHPRKVWFEGPACPACQILAECMK